MKKEEARPVVPNPV